MIYHNIIPATFIRRLNRFLCEVRLDEETVLCHVPNTSRLTELMIPGTEVILQVSDNPARKTRYTLIHMDKAGHWINIDSQAPNSIVSEALGLNPRLIGLDTPPNEVLWRREVGYGHSRFDIGYIIGEETGLIEIKGVTLEEDAIAMFPGAPTTRGVKHLVELAESVSAGFRAHLVLCVQVPYVTEVRMARHIDANFGFAYDQAKQAGVHVHAFRCHITPSEVTLGEPIPYE